MNWGIRVTILYGTFVALMLALVFFSMKQDFSLVSDDYYERQINYQGEIERKKNSAALAEKLLIAYEPAQEKVRFVFPKEMIAVEGDILFYRPSDSGMDKIISIAADTENVQEINASMLNKGLWRVKVNWKSGGKEFSDEKPLIIQ